MVELLKSLGFDLRRVEKLFVKLEELMKRRHQIVHRADRTENDELRPIEKNAVLEWADAVSRFLSQVLAQVGMREAFQSVERLLQDIARERGFEL